MTDRLRDAPGRGHDGAAAWLPGGRRGEAAGRWWRTLADMVEALAERYPRQLAALPDDWWRWPDLAEQASERSRPGEARSMRATSPSSPDHVHQ